MPLTQLYRYRCVCVQVCLFALSVPTTVAHGVCPTTAKSKVPQLKLILRCATVVQLWINVIKTNCHGACVVWLLFEPQFKKVYGRATRGGARRVATPCLCFVRRRVVCRSCRRFVNAPACPQRLNFFGRVGQQHQNDGVAEPRARGPFATLGALCHQVRCGANRAL